MRVACALLVLALLAPVTHATTPLAWSDAAGDDAMTTVVTPGPVLGASVGASLCHAPSSDILSLAAGVEGDALVVETRVQDLAARPVCARADAPIERFAVVDVTYRDEARESWVYVVRFIEPSRTCRFVQGPGPGYGHAMTCEAAAPPVGGDVFAFRFPRVESVELDDGTTYTFALEGHDLLLHTSTLTLADGPFEPGIDGRGSMSWSDDAYAPEHVRL